MKTVEKGSTLKRRWYLWNAERENIWLQMLGLSFLSAILSVFAQGAWTIHSMKFEIAPVSVVHAEEVKELPMKEWVLEEVRKANLDPYEAYVIISCESHFKPDAINLKNSNGSWDGGLWMINSIHRDISNADKFDYKASTRWAINKRLKDGHWKAWVCAKML